MKVSEAWIDDLFEEPVVFVFDEVVPIMRVDAFLLPVQALVDLIAMKTVGKLLLRHLLCLKQDLSAPLDVLPLLLANALHIHFLLVLC